ncbi:acyl-CoA thioesterase [Agarilytica rhodophyticola]|uniref:acyl-CoA thioesterase n=1 Tax=Agarilytica rhodophyticola TaxID=1737490 RepID=UPI000B343EE2|nr:acyl-CoA thioesterase [Agarilytica rhodophyticola]
MVVIDEDPVPNGQLVLKTHTMPRDTNADGDIYGGWLLSQMDIAGAIAAREIAKGRVTTVAVGSLAFLCPIPVGCAVSCYCEIVEIGRSSIKVLVDVWIKSDDDNLHKVTEGDFIYVAIDDHGRTRCLPKG